MVKPRIEDGDLVFGAFEEKRIPLKDIRGIDHGQHLGMRYFAVDTGDDRVTHLYVALYGEFALEAVMRRISQATKQPITDWTYRYAATKPAYWYIPPSFVESYAFEFPDE